MAIEGTIVRRLDLPSGGWVEFRDPGSIRAKHKRKVMRGIDNPERQAAAALDLTEGIAAMFIERWEIPGLPNLPLPIDDLNMLGELSVKDYDAIIDAARPAIGLFFPVSTPDDAGEAGTPTLPASD